MCGTAVLQIQARHKDGAQLWKTSRLPSKRNPPSPLTGYCTVSSALKISMKSECLSSRFRWAWRWSKPGSWWDWTWIQWCVWRLGMRRSTPRWKNQPTVRITTRSASIQELFYCQPCEKCHHHHHHRCCLLFPFSVLCVRLPRPSRCYVRQNPEAVCELYSHLWWQANVQRNTQSNSVLKILWPLLLPQLRGDFCAPCFTKFIPELFIQSLKAKLKKIQQIKCEPFLATLRITEKIIYKQIRKYHLYERNDKN